MMAIISEKEKALALSALLRQQPSYKTLLGEKRATLSNTAG